VSDAVVSDAVVSDAVVVDAVVVEPCFARSLPLWGGRSGHVSGMQH